MTGKEIDKMRLKKGWSIQETANQLGFSHNAMWKVIRGWMPVSKRMVLALKLAGLVK